MQKIVLVLLCFWASLSLNAAQDTLQFSSTQQERDYQQLIQELRCPQCQNNNIADSHATIAADMRAKVLELLQQGQSKQQVVDYMVQRYGHFVTYDPPLTVGTIILWLGPLLLALFGIFILFRGKSKTIKDVAAKQGTALTNEQQQRLQELLNKDK